MTQAVIYEMRQQVAREINVAKLKLETLLSALHSYLNQPRKEMFAHLQKYHY